METINVKNMAQELNGIKLALKYLKYRRLVKQFIENVNKDNNTNIKNLKELSKFMVKNLYLKEKNYGLTHVNPIGYYFTWRKTPQGYNFWLTLGEEFMNYMQEHKR